MVRVNYIILMEILCFAHEKPSCKHQSVPLNHFVITRITKLNICILEYLGKESTEENRHCS